MKKFSLEFKWAIFFSVMTLAWIFFERMLGFHGDKVHQHATFTNFVAIPSIAIYIFGILEKRRTHFHGKMNYAEGFITGLKITLFVMLLSPLVNYLALVYVSPNYLTNIGSYAVSNDLISQEQADVTFSLTSYILQGLIGAGVMGFLTTTVVAIFTRRLPKPDHKV